MQSVEPAPLQFQIRPPWKDELLRLREFMPMAFAETTPDRFLIAVQGPLERIIAGAAIIPRGTNASLLRWRVSGTRYQTRELLSALFAGVVELHSKAYAASRLRLANMIDEGSLQAVVLRAVGFEVEAAHDVYEVDAAKIWERLEPLHQRLTSRGVIPSNARLAHFTADRIPEAAALLRRYLPEGETPLAQENEGFKMEHSYILLVDEVMKGLLLCRNSGEVSHLGVVLVTEDLRGGYRWANVALYYQSLREGLDYNVRRLRFTADPRLHSNTIDFARAWGSERIGTKLRFIL